MHSGTVNRGMRTSARRVGGALGILALTIPANAGFAQEVSPPVVGRDGPPGMEYIVRTDDRARLGVYLLPGCDVVPRGSVECAAPPVVASVVGGAPAAAAGVQPGDTLLSLDGVSLGTESGQRALAELRAGEPVTVRIGRESGRRDIRVTPTARPMNGLFELSGPTWHATAPSTVRVFRLREEDGAVSDFHFTPASDRPAGASGFVVFEADENGALSLEFGLPGVAVYTRDGRRIELAELERRVREAGPSAAQEFAVARVAPSVSGEGRLEVEVESVRPGAAAEPAHRLILENAQLARRLESVHRGTLVEARTRIDSVLRVQGELARRGELPPAAGYAYAFRSGGDAPRPPTTISPHTDPSGLEAPLLSTYRLAGAEFRSLTAELAEYFAVDSGVLVLRVIPETPAQRLGLKGGDVIVEVDGRATPDVTTFRSLIGELLMRGLEPEVKWNRKGQEISGNLTAR